MAYPVNIREKALTYSQQGLTDSEVGKMLGVSKETILGWKKLLFTTGSLEKKKVERKSGTPYKYQPEKIKSLLEKQPKPATLTKSAVSQPSKTKKDTKNAKDNKSAKNTKNSNMILLSPKKSKANKKQKKSNKL